jgi:hypothetical protein
MFRTAVYNAICLRAKPNGQVPTPDYWAALLWSRLVGKVANTSACKSSEVIVGDSEMVRVYCACRPGYSGAMVRHQYTEHAARNAQHAIHSTQCYTCHTAEGQLPQLSSPLYFHVHPKSAFLILTLCQISIQVLVALNFGHDASSTVKLPTNGNSTSHYEWHMLTVAGSGGRKVSAEQCAH